eukprot:TCONS_00017310-protein
MDRSTCSICADYLSISDCTACPCGHTFHYNCIIRWKKESSTCPQCRVRFREPIKLFFEQNANQTIDECDASQLKNEIRDLKCTIQQKDVSMNTIKEQSLSMQKDLNHKKEEVVSLGTLLRNCQGTNDALKRQLSYLEKYKTEAQRARAKAASVENELINFKSISELVKGERHAVEAMVKNYSDTPDAVNVVSTSYVLLKKEYDKLKDSKKKIESEKKTYRRQAESASTEVFESQQKVDTLTKDLKHLNEINKGLQTKLKKLEQAFSSPSPRSSAIKRFMMESPAPMDLKRQCLTANSNIAEIAEEQTNNDGSFILFDGPTSDDVLSTTPPVVDTLNISDDNSMEDEDKELIDEFGLRCVGTTSMCKRDPLKEINKNTTTIINNKFSVKSQKSKLERTASSDFPHLKKGFNGMGGQSKVLYIPKKTSGFKKPAPIKTETTRKLKIPKNNTKMTNFFQKPK